MKSIETPRLILRDCEEKDLPCCAAMFSNPETCANDGGYAPITDFVEQNELLNVFMEQSQKGERYMIALKETDEAVGTIHLMPDDRRAVKAIELGYVTSPLHRRKGYTLEAVKALCDYLLHETDVELISASAILQNTPSLSLLEKAGFIREGMVRKAQKHPLYGICDYAAYYKE